MTQDSPAADWVPGRAPDGPTSGVTTLPLVEYLCRLGDDRLVLGHRLAQWCGHAPILEEDIALSNFALDFVGQAAALLKLAGDVEGQGRDADALAYFRDENAFRNAQLVELPRGDFAFTMVRQFLFDAYDVLLLDGLSRSAHETLAGIAAKALKEAKYHLRHSAGWVERLGDGTEESHARAQRALDELWPFAAELFEVDAVEQSMVAEGMAPDVAALRRPWEDSVRSVLGTATLAVPDAGRLITGGRRGRHTEHLGHMLAEMQILARSHPGAQW
jgi:ring-1,2-phenylacetyl-CoA epoxidase subunit PaaC